METPDLSHSTPERLDVDADSDMVAVPVPIASEEAATNSDAESGGVEEEIDLAVEEAEQEVTDSAPVEGGPAEDPSHPQARFRNPFCPLDLPIAVVRRIMKAAAPNKRFTPELMSLFARSAGAFALYLLSASQEASSAVGRTTMRPHEVVAGLTACGFPEIADEIRVALKVTNKPTKKKRTTKA